MPVREMAGLDATVDATAALYSRRRGRHAWIERIDAVRQPGRRPGLGTGVVDIDVDPEVITRQIVVISPTRVDERPPNRMLHRPRRHRPTPRKRIVGVGETRRKCTRHTAVDRPIRRRLRRHPRSSAHNPGRGEEHPAEHDSDCMNRRDGGQPSRKSQRRSCRGVRECPSHVDWWAGKVSIPIFPVKSGELSHLSYRPTRILLPPGHRHIRRSTPSGPRGTRRRDVQSG